MNVVCEEADQVSGEESTAMKPNDARVGSARQKFMTDPAYTRDKPWIKTSEGDHK